MQTAGEFKSTVNNIKFYVQKLHELNSRQFDLDFENYKLGKKLVDNKLLGELRIGFSGQVGASCELILQSCQNVERQIEIAETQDKGQQ